MCVSAYEPLIIHAPFSCRKHSVMHLNEYSNIKTVEERLRDIERAQTDGLTNLQLGKLNE